MSKFARSDEPKVNQCQINDKCLNFDTLILPNFVQWEAYLVIWNLDFI